MSIVMGEQNMFLKNWVPCECYWEAMAEKISEVSMDLTRWQFINFHRRNGEDSEVQKGREVEEWMEGKNVKTMRVQFWEILCEGDQRWNISYSSI